MSIVITLFGHAIARATGQTRHPDTSPVNPPLLQHPDPKFVPGQFDYAIMGPSTIKPQIFDAALAHRNSPAADIGPELYDIFIRWGVNPSVALGFFMHESNLGTAGIAKDSLNWGNLRAGPAAMTYHQGFAFYSSFAVSADDWARLMVGSGLYVKAGLVTVSMVTPRYAPTADNNNPRQYADAVNAQVAIWAGM